MATNKATALGGGDLNMSGGTMNVFAGDNSGNQSFGGDHGASHSEPPTHTANQAKRRKIDEDFTPLSEDIYICTKRPLRRGTSLYPGYQVLEPDKKRDVAIKVISPFDEKNAKEVECLIKLASHPNVVQILQSKQDTRGAMPQLCIVMELCSADNLQDFLDNNLEKAIFDPKQNKLLARELVDGIKHIHGKGVVHGDIKPGNILFSLDGEHIKVSDFGVSKELRHGRSATKPDKSGVGTDGFRAPETQSKNIISKKSDIYSLGLTLSCLFSNGRHCHGKDPDLVNLGIKNNKKRDDSGLLLTGNERNLFINLLDGMTQFAPDERLTIEQVAAHPFLDCNRPSQEQGQGSASTSRVNQPDLSRDMRMIPPDYSQSTEMADQGAPAEDSDSVGDEPHLDLRSSGSSASADNHQSLSEPPTHTANQAKRRKIDEESREWFFQHVKPEIIARIKQMGLDPAKLCDWSLNVRYRGSKQLIWDSDRLMEHMDGGYRLFWRHVMADNVHGIQHERLVICGEEVPFVRLQGIRLPNADYDSSTYSLLESFWPGIGIWFDVKSLQIHVMICMDSQVGFYQPFTKSFTNIEKQKDTAIVSFFDYLDWYEKRDKRAQAEPSPVRLVLGKRASYNEIEIYVTPKIFPQVEGPL